MKHAFVTYTYILTWHVRNTGHDKSTTYNETCVKTHHSVHKSGETPKGIDFIFSNDQDRRQQVAHALYVAQVKVVHTVGHEDVVQHRQVRVIFTLEELVCSVCSIDIFL